MNISSFTRTLTGAPRTRGLMTFLKLGSFLAFSTFSICIGARLADATVGVAERLAAAVVSARAERAEAQRVINRAALCARYYPDSNSCRYY